MEKLSVMVLTMLLLSFTAFAQDKEYFDKYCGTKELTDEQIEKLPWYGNNDFLLDWADSLEKSSSGMRVERIAEGYQVAVQALVYHRDDGTGLVLEKWQIENWLNLMNETLELNDVPIKFYLLCDVAHINSTRYFQEVANEEMYLEMTNGNYNPTALNIHITGAMEWAGKASPTSYLSPRSLAVRTLITGVLQDLSDNKQRQFASTILHEFGHTVNLLHTHRGRGRHNNAASGVCRQEYVDRNRRLGGLCWFGGVGSLASEVNGDCLRDTDADPVLNSRSPIPGSPFTLPTARFWIDNDVDCNYQPSFPNESISITEDNDGVTWVPPVNNIMSYSDYNCRMKGNSISELQKKIMLYNIDRPTPFNSNLIHHDAEIDEFENDNDFRLAPYQNSVQLSRFPRQHHTLHKDKGSANPESSCDEDWIIFGNNMRRNVIVVTRPSPTGQQADTFIELYKEVYDANGSVGIQLVDSDDNGSQYGAGFSRIERELERGTYYVKVKGTEGSSGHYVIGLFPERENWGSYPSGTGGGGSGNPDGEIDFGVDDPATGGDIDGDGTLDYVCNGAQLNLQGLDGDSNWSVQWSTNNASVSATGGLIQVSNDFSGEVVITAMISYDGALVGNAMKTIWVGAPEAPTLVVSTIRGEGNTLCQGEPIYLSTANSVRGFTTHYKWELYRNGVRVFNQETPTSTLYIDRLVLNAPVGYYQAYVYACNECGCNVSDVVDLEIIANTDARCRSIGGGKGKIQVNSIIQNEIIIYPNPVTNKLTIKLPSIYSENSTQIELYNSIGQLVLSKSYTETNIELPVSSYPKGLYILKIQNGKEMKTEKIVIE